MSETTCGRCLFWHKLPADVHNLAAPSRGQCRQQLHSVAFPTQTLRGLEVTVQSLYPVVPAEFPACGQFQPALALAGAGNNGWPANGGSS